MKSITRSAAVRALAALCLFTTACPGLAENLRDRLRERMEQRREQSAVPANAGLQEYSLEQGGVTRKYLLYVPKSLTPGRPAALVVAFHGGGGDAAYMADDERYGLVSKSEQASFVVAFPNGYSRFPGGRLATWNAGACCGEARDRNVDDVGFVRAMVAEIGGRLNIDRGRVFATGMSNGGMLSHRLACEMSDVFAAVASVAGTDNTRQCNPSRPTAVLHIHAQDDDHVLFKGGAGAGAFRDESKVTDFTSVPETIARWTARDHCSASPVRSLARPGAWCDTYTGCSGGVQVKLCVTETGGHSWPGASKVRNGKEPASQALSADDVIWEFFEANRR